MIKLVFYYPRENRCSVNALAGALETAGPKGLRAVFPGTPAELEAALREGPRARVTAAAFSFFTCQKKETAALAARARAAAPGAILIAGGPHPGAAPLETLAAGFDYVVTGEGEEVFPRLLRGLAAGTAPAPGVLCGGRVDLGDFPPLSAKYGLFGPIEITRGCPYGCTYCQTTYLFGAKPRHRPLPAILRQMEVMLSRDLRDIRFITPDAFAYGSADGKRLNLPALGEFMASAHDLADRRGGRIFVGSFPSEVRPEHVTPETLALLKKYSSSRRLIIGAQTGSPRALRAIRRGHGPEDVLRAARLCREHKIYPYLDFILGLPGETREDEDATMALMEELSALGAMLHIHSFMPLPGTPLAAAPGGAATPRMERFVKRLAAKGKAFGKWQAQRRMAVDEDHRP